MKYLISTQDFYTCRKGGEGGREGGGEGGRGDGAYLTEDRLLRLSINFCFFSCVFCRFSVFILAILLKGREGTLDIPLTAVKQVYPSQHGYN